MVFYDSFAKPSPSRRSISIESKFYYDMHSPTKESCFPQEKGAPTPQKAPKTPLRAMFRGTSQRSFSPSKANTEKFIDRPSCNSTANELTSSHHSNSVEFSTLEGLSCPSFELTDRGAAVDPMSESTASQHSLAFDKQSAEGQTACVNSTSWGNLDLFINLSESDTELVLEPPTDKIPTAVAKQISRQEVPSNKHTTAIKQIDQKSLFEKRQSYLYESRPPVSPSRRSASKISRNNYLSPARASKTLGRRLSLGQTEHTTDSEESNTKPIFSPNGQLRKQNSALDLSIFRTNKHSNVADDHDNIHLSSNCMEQSSSESFGSKNITLQKSQQKQNISADVLSTPERSKRCFPRWKAVEACDQISSPVPPKCMKTCKATPQKEHASPRRISTSNLFSRSPRKQLSERIITSPKWVTSNMEIISFKSPLQKQISAIDLSTPDSSRRCLPHWKAVEACDQTLSPLPVPPKCMKTTKSTQQKEYASPRRTSTSNKFMRSPSKQVSERIITSSKWVASNTEVASPKSPLSKQISEHDLSPSDFTSGCFPRWMAVEACDQVVSPLPPKCTKTSEAMQQKKFTSPRRTFTSNKCIRSPCKQESERIIASPKWIASTTENEYKAKSIPKVSSIHILLAEFDKIMELP